MNAAKILIDFVRCERGWVSAHLVCCELEKLARYSPDQYPRQSVELWRIAIDAAIASGQLEEDGRGNVRTKQEKKKPTKEGWLF